ncbi:hypothetical protein MUN81_20125 [Hymenobacter sp. 5317J-9]|uniref:hypothetical protein n=1 Tax=Hymenobacter sp. 5317J-9 TaxID=2932250 RepID=UPI001FD65096|nr:hypothetical protein [Hymenobacter sp. 5317J-9]UOQ97526.1 hypothetical protein MUN81_20125 [Hymenobacter sp. 5317J-9]
MLRLLLLCTLLLSALAGPARAQQYNVPLGTMPAGWTWQVLPEIKAAMPLPTGWYFKVTGEKGAPTYYLTPEETDENDEFQEGLSVQVVRKAKGKTGRPAADYAELLMMRAGFGSGQTQLEKTATVEGPFYKRTVRYREAPPEAATRIVYQMALANAKTDTLYLLTFEAPEAAWPAAWRVGEKMIQAWVLDARQ